MSTAGKNLTRMVSMSRLAPPEFRRRRSGRTVKRSTTVDVEFDADVAAGSKVWFTAFWFNPRAMSGPACAPISAYVQFGGSMAA
jgi:hypothetical protein